MIQRIQTLWLLLASVFNAITFRFPFYNGDWTKDTTPSPIDLDADTTTPILLITVLTGALAFAAIFLFGNRKLQLKLAIVGLLLAIGMLVLYFLEMQNFTNGAIALSCVFHFAVAALYILAIRGIRSDEKLIKSLDRLR
jgi:peptidoglycan/LPS O-acetylase OafA/YrhL